MNKFNSSYVGLRYDLLQFIEGENLSVLDVGCATGVNGNFLIDNNLSKKIIGIELDSKMAKKAALTYDNVFVGDLNSVDFINHILNNTKSFDYIIFGDILEHLIDPFYALKELSKVLNKNGRIIISVPNIAHLELFMQVFIKGTWPKNERGIFDKTHLSWFTRKDIQKLIIKAGLETITYQRKLRGRDANPKFNILTKIVKVINKDWVTFQHIIVCKHGK
ncbi:class I SAM-dependent methyltransferase [Sabulilitoribacter arenilitoris]|uniref:Class I SAM-dependent methyltransferase n=1 Tax=Wocania arenilitoris TaxID=2044858 RepID=A0AAE3EQV1_9FLAO|nr:class I SAM-dependent methyltransferase [Wocania arenilitoris]MCF7568952.1 class I SAM-dependent methyltransferase [Wocania arenilitoris]